MYVTYTLDAKHALRECYFDLCAIPEGDYTLHPQKSINIQT